MLQLLALLVMIHGSMTLGVLCNAVSILYHFLSNLPITKQLKLNGTPGGIQFRFLLLQGSIKLSVKIFFLPSSRNFSCSSRYLLLLILPLHLQEKPGSTPSTAACQVIEDCKMISHKPLLSAEETIILIPAPVFCLHLAFQLLHLSGGLLVSLLQYSSGELHLVLGCSKLNTVHRISSLKYQNAANPFSRRAVCSFAVARFAVDVFYHKSTLLAHAQLGACQDSRAFPAELFPRQPASCLGCCCDPVCPGTGGTLHLPLNLMGFVSARFSSMERPI